VRRGEHLRPLAIQRKAAGDEALRQVESLGDVADLIWIERLAAQREAQLGEVQPVGIAPQVLDRTRAALVARNAARRGFRDKEPCRPATSKLLKASSRRQPSGLGSRPQPHCACVPSGTPPRTAREGLQSGGVDGEGETRRLPTVSEASTSRLRTSTACRASALAVDDGLWIGHGSGKMAWLRVQAHPRKDTVR
jgi:hypothetical protein